MIGDMFTRAILRLTYRLESADITNPLPSVQRRCNQLEPDARTGGCVRSDAATHCVRIAQFRMGSRQARVIGGRRLKVSDGDWFHNRSSRREKRTHSVRLSNKPDLPQNRVMAGWHFCQYQLIHEPVRAVPMIVDEEVAAGICAKRAAVGAESPNRIAAGGSEDDTVPWLMGTAYMRPKEAWNCRAQTRREVTKQTVDEVKRVHGWPVGVPIKMVGGGEAFVVESKCRAIIQYQDTGVDFSGNVCGMSWSIDGCNLSRASPCDLDPSFLKIPEPELLLWTIDDSEALLGKVPDRRDFEKFGWSLRWITTDFAIGSDRATILFCCRKLHPPDGTEIPKRRMR